MNKDIVLAIHFLAKSISELVLAIDDLEDKKDNVSVYNTKEIEQIDQNIEYAINNATDNIKFALNNLE